jgi:hypothetical protein
MRTFEREAAALDAAWAAARATGLFVNGDSKVRYEFSQ